MYLCLDLKWNSPFALKTFQARYFPNANLRDSFEREVATWVALEKHPNIVRCFYMDIIDDRPFMILEWIASDESAGTDLRSWLRRGPLNYRLSLGLAIDVCRGLSHATQKSPGIVHRDLKPDNVLIAQGPIAKITDFGLAKIVQEADLLAKGMKQEKRSVRRQSNMGGTPPYMAPEQWLGEEIDTRTDIYAVGCILYEMLTGRWPFKANSIQGLRDKHLHEAPPRLADSTSTLIAMDQIVQRCLAKRREERFDTADELLRDLCEVYEQQFLEPPKPIQRTEKFTAVDFNNRGLTYENLHHYEEALNDYTEAIRLAPGFAGAYSNRGLVYESLQRYSEALEDFTQAVALDPNYARAHYNRGHTREMLQQYEAAVEDYTAAIRLDPSNANTWYNLGNVKYHLRQYDEAIEDFTRVTELDPSHVQAFNNRGWTYTNIHRYHDALADLNRAIAMDPTYVQAYYNRAHTYLNLKRLDEALADFIKTVELDPENPVAYRNVGLLLAERGSLREALPYLHKAEDLSEQHGGGGSG